MAKDQDAEREDQSSQVFCRKGEGTRAWGGGGVRSYEALNAGLKSSCMKSKVRVVQSC